VGHGKVLVVRRMVLFGDSKVLRGTVGWRGVVVRFSSVRYGIGVVW